MFLRSLIALSLVLPAAAQIPAFPGAQGFGAYATGGRGGDVYYVTNLNNNGAGSLRVGLSTAPASGRTIVFAVSGYIPVVSDTNFNVPSKVTIAGQTAPGDGVGLRGGRMLVSGSDTVMRHLRIRHGKNGTGGDCLNIASTAQRTMLDHISLMFSTDENFSFFNSSVNNFTMQYSNSTWGMERHNAGGLWDLQNGSCHHTLWAHHRTRNPKARPSMLEWINNVTFHWRNEGFIMGDSQTPANWKANVRGCYYISIDDADDGSTIRSTGLTKATVATNGVPNFSLYLDDTLYDYNDNGVLDGTNRGYGIVSGSEFTPGDPVGANRYYKSATPFTGATGSATVTVDDPLTAYKKVLSSAAPLRLDANYTGTLRDELDTLLVDTVVNQYSILVQKDGKVTGEDPLRTNNGEQLLADQYGITNNGFGTLNGTTPPTDVDLDGMPDFWESTLNGLNGISYNVATADHNTAFTAGQIPNTFLPAGSPVGYTYLEEYLHFLAIPHATVARNTTAAPSVQTVDMRKYTSGFSSSPTFTIAGAFNGSTQQFLANGTTPSANGPIVKFTPTLNATGRAGFNFTVTDSAGSQWTQQFAILVSSAAAPRDLSWIGNGTTNPWDSTTPVWRNTAGAATTFDVGDTTLFDDRGSASPAINITGSPTPGSVLFTGTKNYTLGGTGNIASTGTLTKAGDTTLTINRPTSFVSGTFLNGGETVLNNGGNIACGAIQFTGGSTLTDNTGSNYLTIAPDIKVSAGAVGNLNLSQRTDLNGSLSGGGTFNITSPSTINRVYFKGASAGCTGTINLFGINNGSMNFYANGGSFNGFNNARVNLYGVRLLTHNNSGGNTYAIGSLSGDSSAVFEGSDYAGPTTLDIGGLGLSTTFAGTIKNGSDGTNTILTHLSKSGSGTLTLSGSNTYTGNTAIYGGELRITGSLGATDTFVGSGARLSGSGQVAALLTAQNGSTLSPGNSPGQAGTMSTTNGFDLKAATMQFDLSSNPSSGNDRILNSAGTLTLRNDGGGSANFAFNLIDGYLSPGTYTLVSGGSGTSAPGSPSFTHNLPANTRQTFSLQRSGGGSTDTYVRLVVGGSVGNLTWTGSTSTWDINNTTPWSGGPSGDNRFFNLDTVTFNDSAANRTATLTGSLAPAQVIVNHNGAAYTFNGSGILTGTAVLTKQGSGTLTLANSAAFSHSGGTNIEAGTLALASGSALIGTSDIRLKGGTLSLPNASVFPSNSIVVSANSSISSAFSGNSTILNSTSSTLTSTGEPTLNLAGVNGILSINGSMTGYSGTIAFGSGSGMLRLNSNSSGSSDVNFGSAATHFDLGTGSATLTNRNGNITIHLGALSGGPNTKLNGRQSGSGNTSTTYIIGGKNLSTVFAGSITHANDLDGLSIVKTGTASLDLAGNSSFTGTINVSQGELKISGNTTLTGNAAVDSGATFSLAGGTIATPSLTSSGPVNGFGSITGDLSANAGHTGRGFSSGTPGQLQISGAASFDGGTLRMLGGIQSDTITATDELSLEGTIQISLAPGTSFGRYTLITCPGTLSVGSVSLTGIPGGTTAHLSTTIPGRLDLVIDDSDEDNLPDSWETSSFGNLASGPADDNDHDGTSNLAELRLGLNPASSASAFRATLAGHLLTWPSAPGIQFSVKRSFSLESASWQNVATVTGPPGNTASWTDPSSFEKAFYKVEFSP